MYNKEVENMGLGPSAKTRVPKIALYHKAEIVQSYLSL